MNNKHHYIILGLVLLFLGGCSMAPEYTQPTLPVAETFAGRDIQQQELDDIGVKSSRPLAEISWRDAFPDVELQKLIELALQNNRDLRETALLVQAYQTQYNIQRSALFPSVNAAGAGVKQRSLSGGGHATSETYSFDVGFTSYEIDLYGRIRNLKDQALENYLAMEETKKSAAISLVAEVSKAYLTWLADKELLQITEDTRSIEEESYDLIKQRVDAGIANELALAQARTSLETVKANQARYRRLVAQDLNNLSLLVGTSLPQSLTNEERYLRDVSNLSILPPSLSSDILLQRPDIMAAEHELKGANANIGAARAAFFPTVRLTTSAGYISTDLSDLFDSGSGSWLFSPTIQLPIFNAGRLQAELDYAKIQKDIYISRYEKTIQSAFQEVSNALVAVSTYKDQLQAQRANLEANQEYYNRARDRYQEGVDSFLTLLDAQRSLFSSKQNYLTERLAQLENNVNLYKVLGGGAKEFTE